MESIIEIIYREQPQTLQISCGDKVFDTAQIEGLPLEQWISPFFAKGVRWKGLYEEMKIFAGSESYILRFDSDDDSFAFVKHALAGMPVKLVGMNNTATIVYSEDPVTTKLVINGHIFDTSLLQNRYIDEWVHPFQIRENQWGGIFKELEEFIGTDRYTVYFVGEQKFMNLLIDNCPENTEIFYRDPQKSKQASKAKAPERAASGTKSNPASNIPIDRISSVTDKMIKTIAQNVESPEHEVDTDKIPIKNAFIRKNIVTICAVCAIVFLFLPFAGYSAVSTVEGVTIQSEVIQVSGFSAMFGIKEIVIGINHSVFAYLLLIVPILMVALNYIKRLRPFQKWTAVGVPLLGIVAEVITIFDVGKLFSTKRITDDMEFNNSPEIGFVCLLAVYVVAIIIGLILHHGIKIPKKKQDV